MSVLRWSAVQSEEPRVHVGLRTRPGARQLLAVVGEQAPVEIPLFELAIKRTRSLKEVRVASLFFSFCWSALCAVRGPRGKRDYAVRHAARSKTRGCVSGSSRPIACESGAFLEGRKARVFSR